MNITDILVQSTGSGGAFHGDPGIPHGTLSVVVCIFKLMEIKVDPLGSLFFPVAALQPVLGHCDGFRLVAPVASWRIMRRVPDSCWTTLQGPV